MGSSNHAEIFKVLNLPLEIWFPLSSALDALCLAKLVLLGNKVLDKRLDTCVETFKLVYTLPIVPCWPKLVSRFSKLKSIDIRVQYRDKPRTLDGVDYSILPSSLTSLRVRGNANRVKSTFRYRFPPPMRSSAPDVFSIDIFKHFPLLKVLDVTDAPFLEHFEAWAPNFHGLLLTRLALPIFYSQLSGLLPKSLVRLELQRFLWIDDDAWTLPSKLESFAVSLPIPAAGLDPFFSILTDTLKSLECCLETRDAAVLAQLPKSLISLSLGSTPTRFPINSTGLLLSTSLTHLSMPNATFPEPCLEFLPSPLLTLIVGAIVDANHHTATNLPHLPRSLTHLEARDWRTIDGFICYAPDNCLINGLHTFKFREDEDITQQGRLDLFDRLNNTKVRHLVWISSSDLHPLYRMTRSLESLDVFTGSSGLGAELLLTGGATIDETRRLLSDTSEPMQVSPVPSGLWYSNLQKLSYGGGSQRTNKRWILSLPQTLTDLELQTYSDGEVLRFMPPKLTNLSVSLHNWAQGDVCSLPRPLLSLRVSVLQFYRLRMIPSPSDLLQLPVNICNLQLPKLPSQTRGEIDSSLLHEILQSHPFLDEKLFV